MLAGRELVEGLPNTSEAVELAPQGGIGFDASSELVGLRRGEISIDETAEAFGHPLAHDPPTARLNESRARDRRDRTVPIGRSNTLAISS